MAVRAANHSADGGEDFTLTSGWVTESFTTKAPSPDGGDNDDDDDSGGGGNNPPPSDDDREDGDGGGDSSDVTFRWSMNREAGSGAFYGGCNYIVAGKSGDNGGALVWESLDDDLFNAEVGNVSVRKPNAAGEWESLTWDTRCLDRNGQTLSTNGKDQWSEQEIVITGGEKQDTDDGGVRVEWDGSWTVVFYGGMTYWSVTDPVMELDSSGNGTVKATFGGYGADMDDLTKWDTLEDEYLTLADVKGVNLSGAESDGGFTVTPEYLGVEYRGEGGSGSGGSSGQQEPQSSANSAYWGTFPDEFIDFQFKTGQSTYWLTSGLSRDPYKPTEPLTVAYTSDFGDDGPGSYDGESPQTAGDPSATGGGPPQAANPNAGAGGSPGDGSAPEGASAADADLDEDRSAFAQAAQDDSSIFGIPTRAVVIAGLSGVAGIAATVTSFVYIRRRLGLDPRMFV